MSNGKHALTGRGTAPSLRFLKKLPRNGRTAALHALLLIDAGLNAQEALAAALADTQRGPTAPNGALPSQERHLCSELVYGCLCAEIRIAYILGRVLSRPERLPFPLLHIFELAVYALLFQDRVPDHAAVHGAVEQAERLFGRYLARVANGALRSIQRFGVAVDTPEFYNEGTGRGSSGAWDGLCRYYSLPRWFADIWLAAYGEENALALMRRSSVRPWTALRINARHAFAPALHAALLAFAEKGRGQAVGLWGVAFAPGALPADVLGNSLEHWRRSGALSFQSAGSQLVVEKLGLTCWQGRVWDACAGFGGKSAALLERNVDVTLSTDCAWSRLRHLPDMCRDLHLPVPVACLADATEPPLSGWDGHILLDAPCSGLGVLARRPDIRRPSRRAPADLEQLAGLQNRLLVRLGGLLRPGRELAYITCTLNPAENEQAVSRLLRARPELALVREWQTPHVHLWLEGMYGAVLRRV
ncbi:transcription antitermination factor NusB [uncultured Desulfovibrio sp.]|uniref:transcription antitermination factor NusB n=1 Tax=uncultured Desulfovibrio sp. TaxID=167968 RepID=UPI0026293CBF|nr:transcription antitermination factor NusB [uncultured Desulfovibrio sp.]